MGICGSKRISSGVKKKPKRKSKCSPGNPTAEIGDLKSLQYEFESHSGQKIVLVNT